MPKSKNTQVKKPSNKTTVATPNTDNTNNSMQLFVVPITRPDDFKVNLILGMSHFIKTVEDIHEALMNAHPDIKFGLAFCEASGDKLIRTTGTDKDMIQLAILNAQNLKAGHSFVLFLKDTFPINIMHALRTVPEIVNIYCATANPVQVILAETNQGRGILGVIDGSNSGKVEDAKAKKWRKDFLRQLGYKL